MKFERSRRKPSSLRKGVGRAAMGVLVATVMFAGALLPSASAEAAEVHAIDPASVVITNVTTPGSPLLVRQVTQIDLDWSLQGLNATAGDTFSMQLPKTFQATAGVIDLKVAGGTESAGTCTLSPITSTAGPKLVCVLSDYVDTHDNVHGSLWVRVDAVAETTESNVSILVDGNPVVVALPEGSAIGPQDFGPVPSDPAKRGYFANPERSAIKWVIEVPGSFAGQVNPLIVQDTFANGLTLVTSGAQAPKLESIEASQAGWNAQNWVGVAASQWALVPQDAHSFTATLQQPIQQDRVYRLSYVTAVDHPGNLVLGDVFDNSATLNGVTRSTSVEYKTVGGGNAQGSGRGGFVIAKQNLAGNGAAEVPSTTTYRVTATITEPGGAPHDVDINLSAGGSAEGVSDLPEGTTVHLEEVVPTNTPDYVWEAPKFSSTTNPNVVISADGTSVDFQVVSDGTFRFSLVNTVTKVTKPESFAIGDYTWIDANRDGLQDPSEKVLPGVTVTLADANGDPVTDLAGEKVQPTLTDANGYYHFDNLPAGQYTVHFAAPEGYTTTTQAAGTDPKIDSNADQKTGWTSAFELGVAQGNTTPAEPSDGVTAHYIDRTIDAGFFVKDKQEPGNGWVEIVKDDGRVVVKPGELLNYSLIVSNKSGLTAKQVQVRDVLPANVDLISTSIVGVVSVDNPLALEWDLGDVAAGETRTIVVTVRVHAGLPGDTRIVNTATVTTQGECVDRPETPTNECKSTDIDRTAAGVWILKTDNSDTVRPGGNLTYDITVGNSSDASSVSDATVTDKLPANVSFVSATDGGTYNATTRGVTWTGVNLQPSESRVMHVTVRVNDAAHGSVVNTAKVKAAECDGAGGDEACSSTDRTTVKDAPLAMTGSSDLAGMLVSVLLMCVAGGAALVIGKSRRRMAIRSRV
ncbi:DUF11 domain-containing protein [Leucobacter viscericola]|uniref:DUF11 domain-containing protein n=1 Tax=Leucobacter viscericola TaxID=2714935 RepID=A0A6G7XDR4_9MICO|nr:SdrD B-like domain-containing protein [Leucobacter viscericola]QIK62734.1 DUF11 domain-containing protein [Leucobacter viscericola]